MTIYKYTGRDQNRNAVDGILEAANQKEIAQNLLRTGITPITIAKVTQQTLQLDQDIFTSIGIERKPSLSILSVFCRQMATLLGAGISVLSALQGLMRHIEHPGLCHAIHGLTKDLEAGRTLSTGMQRFPTIFPPLLISMVHVGENTGQLERAFEQTCLYLEIDKNNQDQVKAAMRYPLFVSITIVFAMVAINIFVIPAFSRIFDKLDGELPITTQILISSSNFTVNHWPILLIFGITLFLGARTYLNTETGRYQWDKLKLKIPLVGSIVERATLARFSRAFSMASTAGIPINQTLSIVSQAVDNDYLAKRILEMREGLERGESLSKTVSDSHLFTPLVLQMISVGESSGAVDKMLDSVADLYEREVEYDTKKLNSTIEPILVTVIGIIVLVLALGIFLPMWSLGGAALAH